jgi:hypothetical protein
MRASPPLQVALTAFGFWRVGVMLLASAAAASPLAWLASQPQPTSAIVLLAALLMSLAALIFGMQLQRVSPRSLRWDGQRWHLGALHAVADEALQGDLRVAIDLGAWMLLCFAAQGSNKRSAVSWLPVQRRGLEAHWHALRCAVYSPHPAPDEDIPARV